jgi:hypothetical protein
VRRLAGVLLKNENEIFTIRDDRDFREVCLKVFRIQYEGCRVYRQWVDLLATEVPKVNEIEQIPFLPIEAFKNQVVVTGKVNDSAICFTSSSTTSQVPARHFVTDIALYERSFTQAFSQIFDGPQKYCILALLPNYLERSGSSLVYMCRKLIGDSKHPSSGFFLKNISELKTIVAELNDSGQQTILIGVSYALMDLADTGLRLGDNFKVIETGGMKGTRKEMLKAELHKYLISGLGVSRIYSEYGMTELLSQAYSTGDGLFSTPPWMRFLVREVDDPLHLRRDGKTGGINVIDLANINSCSFIATKDLGRLHSGNRLELMGRYDNSDVRGCNLMVEGF